MTTNASGDEAELAPDERPFPFAKLSAEMRNEMYNKILEDTEAILDPRAPGQLISTSLLAILNRQIRGEFLSRLPKLAAIVAHVQEFEFDHVKQYFQRNAGERSISIELSFADQLAGACKPYYRELTFGRVKTVRYDTAVEKIRQWTRWLHSRKYLQTQYTLVSAQAENSEALRMAASLLIRTAFEPEDALHKINVERAKMTSVARVYEENRSADIVHAVCFEEPTEDPYDGPYD